MEDILVPKLENIKDEATKVLFVPILIKKRSKIKPKITITMKRVF
jgi:hypothetical protein